MLSSQFYLRSRYDEVRAVKKFIDVKSMMACMKAADGVSIEIKHGPIHDFSNECVHGDDGEEKSLRAAQ